MTISFTCLVRLWKTRWLTRSGSQGCGKKHYWQTMMKGVNQMMMKKMTMMTTMRAMRGCVENGRKLVAIRVLHGDTLREKSSLCAHH